MAVPDPANGGCRERAARLLEGIELLLEKNPTNDLAILRVRQGDSFSKLPPPLHLSDANPKLGEETIVVGFPLGSILGASHKVTIGT